MSEERQVVLLLIALAIGLLIGVERGWRGMREEKPHLAGVRTFGLIGLLGGATGLTVRDLEPLLYGFVFIALAGAMTTAQVLGQRSKNSGGVTSLIAALLTFALGTLATLGHIVAAVSAAVVSALLLGFKPQLHRWVERIEEPELQATLKLLLITVVLLPILPDRGYGPGGVLNPYEIWWMVVLIAAISFSGYVAVKAIGTDKGVILTSFLAGLASSTALTLHLARHAGRRGADLDLLGSGILLATVTLFPRILLIAAVLQPQLAIALSLPMVAMSLVVLGPGLLAWRRRAGGADRDTLAIDNPLELGAALRFGAFLAAVLLLARWLSDLFGDAGILALGALSGVADLNAITLSVARMSREELQPSIAVATIFLATVSNGVFKSIIAWVIGGAGLGIRVALPVLVAGVAGAGALWFDGHWPVG